MFYCELKSQLSRTQNIAQIYEQQCSKDIPVPNGTPTSMFFVIISLPLSGLGCVMKNIIFIRVYMSGVLMCYDNVSFSILPLLRINRIFYYCLKRARNESFLSPTEVRKRK